MLRTYQEIRAYLEQYIPAVSGQNLIAHSDSTPLDRMRYLLKLLDNPQEKLKSIVVSGTSGKGSTSYLLAHMLSYAGYKTGLTISPHLEKINERMQIGRGGAFDMISDQKLATLIQSHKETLESMKESSFGPPSYYEVLLALCFVYFVQEQVDIAVVEVGLEGKYDGTNTLDPLMFILTNISLDHTALLGNSVEEITTEAVDRIRPSVQQAHMPVVISAVTQDTCRHILRQRVQEAGWGLLENNIDFTIDSVSQDISGVSFRYSSQGDTVRYRTSLRGAYQSENAALAITAAKKLGDMGYTIDNPSIHTALMQASFPGRFELLSINDTTVILDGAHNEAKMHAFISALTALYPEEKKTFILGFKKGKELSAMLPLVIPVAHTIILTQFTTTIDWGKNLGMDTSEALESISRLPGRKPDIIECPDVASALDTAYKQADKQLVIATGSLYLVGEVRSLLH